MLVLHASLETDSLLLWGEASVPAGGGQAARRRGRRPKFPRPARHPFEAGAGGLVAALAEAGVDGSFRRPEDWIAWLPSVGGAPSPSSGLIGEPPDPGAAANLAPWTVAACRLSAGEAVDLLCACVNRETLTPGVVIGKDLAFAAALLHAAGSLVARQRFLPGLEETDGAFRAVWRPVFADTDAGLLARLARAMPPSSRALHRKADAPPQTPVLPHLTGFIGSLVDSLVRTTVSVARQTPARSGSARKLSFDSPHDQWLHALHCADGVLSGASPAELAGLAVQIRDWQRPVAVTAAAPFRLTLRLEEPPESNWRDAAPAKAERSRWFVRYLLQSTRDLSLLLPAEEVWKKKASCPPALLAGAGLDAREYLLTALGEASRIDPDIEKGLRSPAPAGHSLNAAGAYEFLTERAVALEQAGFGLLLPAWWTRSGAKARLTVKAIARSPKLQGGSGLNLEDLIRFRWQVAVGDAVLTFEELEALAELKAPLVRVRGQWVEVKADQIAAALAIWKRNEEGRLPAREIVRMALGAAITPGGLPFGGVSATGWVADLLERLERHSGFEELPSPGGFQGTLRPYQVRGFSWLAFLRECGLGACLADDMGLGKTVQALALIQRLWRAGKNGKRGPTLLVCPTSVVGNWEKEAARFTPRLSVLVHHGVARKRGGELRAEAARHAIILSSYALLQRDIESLKDISWSGVILDEAQNIKNPETRQARAARALRAGHRVALTGTPVENNVGDLWSLMEFLNPSFLGTQAEFKRSFFIPIQASRDAEAMERLKRLTGPFVLRRLKTDKTIIADLPEKMEMKVFCTLTPEQASLYRAVVAEAAEGLEEAQGIQRKGLVLATLSKLKQVCNHPAHFLKDNSQLSGRSGKLARLTEMLEEVLAENDRALVFSQFFEMGALLRRHLEETFGREALFLHGGVTRAERDRMVERFQTEKEGPRLFILSLKAGGTGLNLTAANHVFHFDRWWNPAVENQATDRAFRIGQARRVQVHKFLCAGTLEEKIDEMIESKKELAGKLVGTGEWWLTELSTGQLKELFALRKEAVAE